MDSPLIAFRATPDRAKQLETIRAYLASIGAAHSDVACIDFALNNGAGKAHAFSMIGELMRTQPEREGV